MARFDRLTVYNTMIADGMVPLYYHADVETALSIAGALARGGARTVEFTNRGDFALDVFSALVKTLAREQPQIIVGVGSIEDAPTAALFLAHGANFVVAPNFNPDVARLCNRRKIAYLPGVGSVSEIAVAEEYSPRPWTRILPSGGVTTDEANLRTWFDAGAACVAMGSHLVRGEWVKAGDYAALEAATAAALATIRTVRGK
jgi:2-dehydro-3-deoxyphosphogluconate aldolase / (4S)-4-hydroxy-2-oxoglutarate aldolase